MSRPDDLVGYTYQVDLYCPNCILPVLNGRDPFGIAGGAFVFSVDRVEAALDYEARLRGIDRSGTEPFDSGEFPAVVFRSDLGACEHCQGAGDIEFLYGPLGHEYHGRRVRCGQCDGTGSPDRCGRCRQLLAEVIP